MSLNKRNWFSRMVALRFACHVTVTKCSRIVKNLPLQELTENRFSISIKADNPSKL